jgi:hypothetical protein
MRPQEGSFDVPLPPSREHGVFDVLASTLWTISPCRSPLFPSTEHDAHHNFTSRASHLMPRVDVPCIDIHTIRAVRKAIMTSQQAFIAGIVLFA